MIAGLSIHPGINTSNPQAVPKTGIYIRVMVMVFNATFNNISVVYRGCHVDCWRKQDPEKTTDLPEDTDKYYHNLYIYLYSHKANV